MPKRIFLTVILTAVLSGATYAGGDAIGELELSAAATPAYSRVPAPEAAEPAKAETGKPDAKSALQKYGCLACHRYKGEGGTFGPALDAKLKRHSRDWVKKKLLTPLSPAMPPFSGTDKELDEFIDMIQQ